MKRGDRDEVIVLALAMLSSGVGDWPDIGAYWQSAYLDGARDSMRSISSDDRVRMRGVVLRELVAEMKRLGVAA